MKITVTPVNPSSCKLLIEKEDGTSITVMYSYEEPVAIAYFRGEGKGSLYFKAPYMRQTTENHTKALFDFKALKPTQKSVDELREMINSYIAKV